MFSKLKQYKDLRNQAKRIQGALSTESVQTDAAWGKVKVSMSGNMEITSVTIDPSLLAPAEKSKLESAVKDAANDAIKKTQKVMAAKVKEMGGLEMPK
ncbi:nucleoid-associated protein, YbaB/EbfC family [Candidatus Uhrbacteria bacterium RIFCSPHIGHO2_12_FULL_57_11]|uniref:Nucleoid-associated protein, YbaB/EbfC family n=2 Tax=Candidatus Uhriibacteriota TaxID=1752732 RepID=A0A1F7UN97_9BACT|nr:MAG: nucleoid-associated protein, YbaB/EbfC family [Candidatus Uhrbacteria bacterium RIFCSPHIGHO2_02_FULL_57_19]OGL79729.1 MAG: nucleoid-associated protein, YbaB/EbfC family [Candidatus Uhrbacteria bacterium RIFCSPHIGHO2_12_FULL_57_11]